MSVRVLVKAGTDTIFESYSADGASGRRTWTWPLQPPHNTSFPHIQTPLANLQDASSNTAQFINCTAANRSGLLCSSHHAALDSCWMALLMPFRQQQVGGSNNRPAGATYSRVGMQAAKNQPSTPSTKPSAGMA